MPYIARDRLFIVWTILIVVTLLSARIGGESGLAGTSGGATVTTAVLAIAFGKMAAVIFTYMDIGRAPKALKLVATTWLTIVFLALLAVYHGVLRGI